MKVFRSHTANSSALGSSLPYFGKSPSVWKSTARSARSAWVCREQLPTLNEKVVEYAIKMGHAMHCQINGVCKQDRKNYFYPDLPKAYQISQAEVPLCGEGYLDVMVDGKMKRIGVTRIHIEEDAGNCCTTSRSPAPWSI